MIRPRPAEWIVRHPRVLLLLGAAVVILAIVMLRGFRMEPDVSALFPRDDPTLRLTRRLHGDSGPSRTLLVVLRAEEARDIDRVLPKVVERLRASPHIARVIATREEFAGPRYDWIRQAPLPFLSAGAHEKLKARLMGPERRAHLQTIKQRIAEDPISGKQLVLNDPLEVRWIFGSAQEELSSRFPARTLEGSPYLVFEKPAVAFIRVVGARESYDVPFSAMLLEDVRDRLKAVLGPVRLELAGGYVTATYQAAVMRSDLRMQAISSAVMIMLFLTWFTRNWIAPHVLMIPVAVSILLTLSFGYRVLGPLTPLAVAVTAIMMAQGIDYSIHLFSRYRDERRALGRDEAMVATIGSLGRPFFGALATTALTLLILLASRFPGLRQFGILVSFGIAACAASAMTVLVPLLIGIDRFTSKSPARTPLAVRWAHAVDGSRARLPIAALIALAGVGSWAVVVFGNLRVDLDLRNVMPKDDPGAATIRRLEGDLGISMTPVIALVDEKTPVEKLRAIGLSEGPDALFPSPEAQVRTDRFRAETQGWVEGTLEDLRALGYKPEPFRKGLDEMNAMFRRTAPVREALDREEFAALRNMFLYEDEGRLYWVVYFFPSRPLWRPEDRERFDREARAHLGEDARFFSAYHMPDHYERVLVRDLKVVGGWSILAVAVLTMLAVTSLRGGFIALVPMVVAAGATLAVCTLRGGTINLMNLVALPLIIGVSVDTGIYFVSHFQQGGRTDPGRSILEVGPGTWGSTATTILGFGSIAFSVSPGLASLGELVLVGLASGFVASLLLLPTAVRCHKSG